MSDRAHTIADIAASLGIRPHAVLALIHSGQLRAVDVSLKGRKPRWRILPEDLEGFFARRTPQPAGPRKQRRKPNRNIIQYF